jgi:hypothetical protein
MRKRDTSPAPARQQKIRFAPAGRLSTAEISPKRNACCYRFNRLIQPAEKPYQAWRASERYRKTPMPQNNYSFDPLSYRRTMRIPTFTSLSLALLEEIFDELTISQIRRWR